MPLVMSNAKQKKGIPHFLLMKPGGLTETITSPSGAKTTRLYTTNGLLKEEIYPDGTKSSLVYDFFGRPIRETKNDITWEITYDDPHHRVTRTNIATKASEIREFDARGNLIRFTDAAGYTSEKTYDGLNRVKTETSPSGQQTVWSYQGDTIICTLPNGEKQTQRYEGGRVAESEVVDAKRQSHRKFLLIIMILKRTFKKLFKGKKLPPTWMNALGLPIKVQKGNITTTYEYDSCGNCIAMTMEMEGQLARHSMG